MRAASEVPRTESKLSELPCVSLAEPDAVASEVEPSDEEPLGEEDAARDDGPDEFELGVFEPVEPLEPVVSANATAGIEAIAAPTPKATASAPTRPTWLE